jgi:FixJ family two-component response regulator
VQDHRSVSSVADDTSFRVALTTFLKSFGFNASGLGRVEDSPRAPEFKSAACILTNIQRTCQTGTNQKLHLGIMRPDVSVSMIKARSEATLLAPARKGGAHRLLHNPSQLTCWSAALKRRSMCGEADHGITNV